MEDFDPKAALDAAQDVLNGRQRDLTERITAEYEQALSATREYAQHLAAGGDPRDYPKIPYESRYAATLISPTIGLRFVYYVWNTARGSTNPLTPIQAIPAWQVAE